MNLIGYLSNGYPTIQDSYQMAKHYIDAGCDIIEIDFPDTNPYLENELIQGRMATALTNCSDYDQYMAGMIRIKNDFPQAKFILLAYESTVKAIGQEKFARFALDNGFDDLIFVGLTNNDIKDYLMAQGIKVSCYIQYHLPQDEIDYAIQSNGFVYLQAKPTTGNINPAYPKLQDCINYLRGLDITAPIYCGVGVHTLDDVAMVKAAGADGIFVGSTILKLHDDIPALQQVIRDFKAAC
ncbi:tryptophan synthase alpha chain [Shewanella sp. NFH-SH190041]|uniref:tryptophan synthase subunit alpha n=1 Tax=Shewanella sp. NFH-SH190041 TaxID=2950245 RepID=UPI0021C3BD13|nr:tryptophan synthase subunit alpha [Shewanella sp. NFH-SH190041]BDM63323.1 tryptophan synthase alpha chain [Shewanella sp. NFH-SH190041]